MHKAISINQVSFAPGKKPPTNASQRLLAQKGPSKTLKRTGKIHKPKLLTSPYAELSRIQAQELTFATELASADTHQRMIVRNPQDYFRSNSCISTKS